MTCCDSIINRNNTDVPGSVTPSNSIITERGVVWNDMNFADAPRRRARTVASFLVRDGHDDGDLPFMPDLSDMSPRALTLIPRTKRSEDYDEGQSRYDQLSPSTTQMIFLLSPYAVSDDDAGRKEQDLYDNFQQPQQLPHMAVTGDGAAAATWHDVDGDAPSPTIIGHAGAPPSCLQPRSLKRTLSFDDDEKIKDTGNHCRNMQQQLLQTARKERFTAAAVLTAGPWLLLPSDDEATSCVTHFISPPKTPATPFSLVTATRSSSSFDAIKEVSRNIIVSPQ